MVIPFYGQLHRLENESSKMFSSFPNTTMPQI